MRLWTPRAGVLTGAYPPGYLAALRDASSPLWVHSVTLAEVLVRPVMLGVAERLLQALGAIGVVCRDHSSIAPVGLARLRVLTDRKLPDCFVLAVAKATDDSTVLTFDDRRRRVPGLWPTQRGPSGRQDLHSTYS